MLEYFLSLVKLSGPFAPFAEGGGRPPTPTTMVTGLCHESNNRSQESNTTANMAVRQIPRSIERISSYYLKFTITGGTAIRRGC